MLTWQPTEQIGVQVLLQVLAIGVAGVHDADGNLLAGTSTCCASIAPIAADLRRYVARRDEVVELGVGVHRLVG